MADFARDKAGPLLVGDRPLPQSIDAERAVISCVLIDPGATIDQVFAQLKTDQYFHHPGHRKIYNCLREMRSEMVPSLIDLITLTDRLERRNELEDIGGEAYLNQLLNTVPTTANLERYLECVQDAFILRRLIGTCSEIVGDCYDCDGNVSTLVDKVESEIMAITEKWQDSEAIPVRELMPDAIQYLDDLYNHKPSTMGLQTGYDIDKKITGLKPGELVVLAARPSIGKTTLAMNMARNISLKGNAIAFFSLEMSNQQVVIRLLCTEARINLKDVRDGKITNAQWTNDIMAAGDRLRAMPIYLEDTPQLSAMEIRQKSRRLKQDHDIKAIIIDYLQLMRPSGGNSVTNREQEVAKLSSEMKSLAKELHVPVLLLAQLNRQAEQGGRPKLSQLRESGAIEQDADVVMLLHRARETETEDPEATLEAGIESELIIAKNRNGETGIVNLLFIPQFTSFENASRVSEEDVPA